MQREQTATPKQQRKLWETPQLIELNQQLEEVNNLFAGIAVDGGTTGTFIDS